MGVAFSPPKPQPPPIGRFVADSALSRSDSCLEYQVTVCSPRLLVSSPTAATISRTLGRITEPFARQVPDILSTSTSTPFRPSMTTHAALSYLSISQSASHCVPAPVGLRSISDIRAGPSFGSTAPHRLTSDPSAENFTPYAVLPSGFNSSDLQASHTSGDSAASAALTTGIHQPRRSLAKVSGAICSTSLSMVESRILRPRAGFVFAHRAGSATSPIASTENSNHAVVFVSPPRALSRMPRKTVPGVSGPGGVPT